MGARDLLDQLTSAGLSVTVNGGDLVIRPREMLTEDMRAAVRASKADLLAVLLTPPALAEAASQDRTSAAVAATNALLRRLRRVGLDESAAMVATWVRTRDGEADDRRLCIECAHFSERGNVCRHPELVAIQAPRDLGQLAVTPQRCGGFSKLPTPSEQPKTGRP